jgi:hypothetical protein
MSTDDTPLPLRQKAGVLLAVAGGPILAMTYWEYQDAWAWLDFMPPIAVALLSAAVCGVGGWLAAGKPMNRVPALLGAALAGFGGSFVFNVLFATSTRLSGVERWGGFLLGALPGVILGVVWINRLERRAAAKTS